MSSSIAPDILSPTLVATAEHGPVPTPTSDTAPYWEAAARHELHVPHCRTCERYFFYPRAHCRYCQSDDVEWRRVSGRGRLLSYVINHKPFPEFQTKEPQVVAVVALDEGVNIMSQVLTDRPVPEALPLGLPLQVVFIQREGITLPYFVPSSEESTDHA